MISIKFHKSAFNLGLCIQHQLGTWYVTVGLTWWTAYGVFL